MQSVSACNHARARTRSRVLKYRLILYCLDQSGRTMTMLRKLCEVGTKVKALTWPTCSVLPSSVAMGLAQLRRYSSMAEGQTSPLPCGSK